MLQSKQTKIRSIGLIHSCQKPIFYDTFLDLKKRRNISLRAEEVEYSFCFVLLETPAYEADEPENIKPQW